MLNTETSRRFALHFWGWVLVVFAVLAGLPAAGETVTVVPDENVDLAENGNLEADDDPPDREPPFVSVPGTDGNLYFETGWDPRSGLVLNFLPDPVSGSRLPTVDLQLGPGTQQLLYYSAGGRRGKAQSTAARWRPEALPSGPRASVEWLLKIRSDGWLLYADDHWVAWFPAPFAVPMQVAVGTAADVPVGIPMGNAFFQRVEPWRFSDDFMMPENEEAGLGAWIPVEGEWHVHTLLDAADLPQRQRRGRTLNPEFSPNFYSLKGMGTNAVIATGYDFYDRYRFSAAMELQPGEMGLVFHYSEISGEYYAFTLTLASDDTADAQAALWRTVDGDPDRRRYLAAARVPDMLPDQWLRMEIETRYDGITARIDSHTVFDLEHNLPGGGGFGFFVDADTEIILDDVLAESSFDLDLRDSDRIRFHQAAIKGDFFPRPHRSWLARLMGHEATPPPADDRLMPAVSDTDQWLAVGAAGHAGQVVEAVFHPETEDFQVGLVAGIDPGGSKSAADTLPHWLFAAQRTGNEMIFRLFRVELDGRMTLMEKFGCPAKVLPAEPVHLMLDMSEGRRLRFYYNRRLVLIHETDERLAGAVGPFVGAGTRTAVSDLSYRFGRRDFWTSSREKNPVFLTDPFMRHWSSPEGEWYADNNGLTWHKSDFFGRFDITLPIVTNAAVHLGVREGDTNGTLVVEVRNGIATLFAATAGTEAPQRVMSAELLARRRDATNQPLFSIHYEDHWLFVTADDRTVVRHVLDRPLEGSRVRIQGFSLDDLAVSEVVRHRVDDHLFTAAPAEWRLNGGDWRVVNRFQCDPRWSHMNAESKENLAAAWTKNWFEGDFSVEMYAGMRHGWYDRCGDMNLTVMSRDGTPSQGYTVTCTGWDQDLSQLDSVFYRHGVEMERTDAYLAPRRRAGNRRRLHEAVVRAGRDVHGAWYYIKLRRIGNRVEYYFDNELVFTWEEDDPIENGRVGVWTFMNSIMIARVSISARNRMSAPLDYQPLAVAGLQRPVFRDPLPGDEPAADQQAVVMEETFAGVRPPMQPGLWDVDDPVGQALMSWYQDVYLGPYFTLTSRLGGGPMFAAGRMPAQKYRDLAGWRFSLKRTERANLNAYFSIGQRDGKGVYQPSHHYFHRISGADFDRGEWRRFGSTAIPGTAPANRPDWHAQGRWQTVSVWLPTDELPAPPESDNLWVRFEGFGVRQPSPEMQGLRGNGPGEAYAVARFHAVAMQAPWDSEPDPGKDLGDAVENGAPVPEAIDPATGHPYRLYAGPSKRHLLAQGDRATVVSAIRQHAVNGLNAFWIDSQTDRPGFPHDLAWITTPENNLELNVAWCDEKPDTLILQAPVPWPERRLAQAAVSVGERRLSTREVGLNRRVVRLPPGIAAGNGVSAPLALKVDVAPDLVVDLELDAADPSRRPLGPVLARLEGITPIYENFENLEFGSVLSEDPKRMRLRRDDARQGAYVEIANRGLGQRLQTALSTPVCLARYPVMQFRYRGDRMSMLSLRIHNAWFVRLNEPHPSAAEVRFAGPFVNDGNWHTWSGMLSEVVQHQRFNPRMYAIREIHFGSFHGIDQTGALSRWALDDVVIGPAVARADQLSFKARFEGLVPVSTVQMALKTGLDPVGDWGPEELEALAWQTIGNDEEVTPSVDTLPDGPAQLVLRAADADGVLSAPVVIPFLLDRQAPRVTHVFDAARHPLGNGTMLRLDFDTGDGSPVLLETLRLGLNKQPAVEIDAFVSSVAVRAPGLRASLNWPYLLRDAIRQHSPGEPAVIHVSGLRDGAGNPAPDIEVPVAIPDERDQTGPALLPAAYPAAVFFNTAWEGRMDQPLYFSPAQNNPASIQHPWNEEPWMRTMTHGDSGSVILPFRDPAWRPADYPFLAFRVRQPVLRPENPVHLDLVLNLDNRETVTLSLTHPATAGLKLAMVEPIEWGSNQWHSVILDVPGLLREAEVDSPDRRMVNSIAFARSNAVDKLQLDIQSLFVFRPWSNDETAVIDAYDQSGVDGLEWVWHDPVDNLLAGHLDPRIDVPSTPGWLLVRVRDRRDNLSVPLRIPLVLETDDAASGLNDRIRRAIRLAE